MSVNGPRRSRLPMTNLGSSRAAISPLRSSRCTPKPRYRARRPRSTSDFALLAASPLLSSVQLSPSMETTSLRLRTGLSFVRVLIPLLVFCGCTAPLFAQLNVSLEIKRRVFIANEPVIATVTIVNNTGHDILLADTEEGGQWFSFQILANEGRLVRARNPN